MGSPSEIEKLRHALTLKNLRRHDDKIVSIVVETPHAVVYDSCKDEHGDDDWAPSEIEGRMFLFQRSQSPFFGFMILPTKGLKYTYELLSPAIDIVSQEGMIMYRASVDEDRATGIWVQDDKNRPLMFERMVELLESNAGAPPAAPALASPIPYNQSLPLDLLFASSPSAATAVRANPLAPTPATTTYPPPLQSSGLLLLDSIFKSAQPAPPPPPPPPVAPATPIDGRALLAMIGHPGGSSIPAQPAPGPCPSKLPSAAPAAPAVELKPSTATAPPPLFAPPILSHDLFSQAGFVVRKKKASDPTPAPAPAPIPVVASRPAPVKVVPVKVEVATSCTPPSSSSKTSSVASLPREMISPLLNGSIAHAQLGMNGSGAPADDGEPLSKTDFIKGVTAMLQKPAFQMGLYSKYLARFSERMESDGT